MCSKHYHEKYNGQRPINKRPFPFAPSAEERVRRVKLSAEWLKKAQISEYIKLMVDHEESDEETSEDEKREDEECMERWNKKLKELRDDGTSRIERAKIIGKDIAEMDDDARALVYAESCKFLYGALETHDENDSDGEEERLEWKKGDWGDELDEIIEEEWDEEEWFEMKRKLKKCGLKLSLIKQ